MLKENWRLISRLERLGDFLIVVASFFIAYYGRASLIYWSDTLAWELPFAGGGLAPIKDYFIVLVVAVIGYLISLQALGAYNSMRLRSSLHLLRISVLSSLMVFLALAALLFLLKIDFSRSFIVLFCTLVCLLLAAERYVVLEFLRFWRRRGKNFRNIIICGVGGQALNVAREIQFRSELGIRIRGFADLAAPRTELDQTVPEFKQDLRKFFRQPVGRIIPGVDAVERALKEYAIDEVIFTDVIDVMPEVQEVIHICADQGVRTTLAADLFSIGVVQSEMSYFAGLPLIHFQTPPGDVWQLTVKRIVDQIVSGLLLVLLSPVFFLIALGIKLSSKGPVLFRQRRVGLNGRLFWLYKFRSMCQDAESRLKSLQEHNEMQGPTFKMKRDPRVTGFGKFLRRFSLDELPQLWNVFAGDMSLVGPRPPVPGEVSLYERRDRRRLSMRPGITCTWQVSGRNEITSFESWVRMDLEYIDNWSLRRDFLLLFRTIPAVVMGTGAR